MDYQAPLSVKRSAAPDDGKILKKCLRCGVEFLGMHIQKRCDPCRVIVEDAQKKKANERQKAARAAARLGQPRAPREKGIARLRY